MEARQNDKRAINRKTLHASHASTLDAWPRERNDSRDPQMDCMLDISLQFGDVRLDISYISMTTLAGLCE